MDAILHKYKIQIRIGDQKIDIKYRPYHYLINKVLVSTSIHFLFYFYYTL